MTPETPTTALCRHDSTSVHYRDKDLVRDLLDDGGGDFMRVMAEHILGRPVDETELKVLNAVLIVLMEHGLTPSAIATREVYMSAPENLQGAVAAGLLAVGSRFVGTMENNAGLLESLVGLDDAAARARAAEIAKDHRARRAPVPGFGHHLHKPDDPRAQRLLALADELGLDNGHVRALRMLGEEVDRAAGKHVTINATGAIAALLGEIGVPVRLMRGFAVIARAAGLVAHIGEEQQRPSGRYIWELVDGSIPYAP